ncbi:MAG TPA: redoxin domain-containing protein [Gemmataceae bacterium]|nr:redoxin domain-containing protein [Gemmataceae bacterium]
MFKRLIALLLLAGSLAPFVVSGEKAPSAPGKKVADFTLPDPRQDGKKVSLADVKDKVVVVVFVGTECPISNAYMPRLVELHAEFAKKGVAFLAINANSQDTPERVAKHAKQHELPFPVLKDAGNVVADLFEAKRTPEAFVLDAERKVRYRGRIDDQYGVGFTRAQPGRRDLAEALTEVLAGKPVTTASAEVAGCQVARLVKPKQTGRVTYAKDVSRILQDRCQECHRPGQIGPMSLLTYDAAAAWSETIREVVQEGRMPPWPADPKYGKFSNDRHLSDNEKKAVLAWIDAGCPKGDDKDLPPPKKFADGWRIDKPDVVLSMPEEFTVPAREREGVPYKYFWVDPHFDEDKWVTQAEAKAGATSVVHHILVFVELPGTKFDPERPIAPVLCGVAPGDTTLVLPRGVAKRVPKGSKLVFQMHYTPDGKERKDRSSIGLVFAKAPPEREAITLAVCRPGVLYIPAGTDNQKADATFTFREDGHILGFMPHMHLRGKDFTYEARVPGREPEVLLSVPHYNFGWQASYRLETPYPMPKGSKLHCVGHFDNSAKNPNNPDPTKDVTWGDQTWEEMLIGWTEIVYDRKPK